jgi:hypothetical protein
MFHGIKPSRMPLNISITLGPCDKAQNLLPVQTAPRDNWSNVHNFTVCIGAALRDRYADYKRFVEFMELNILLGAKIVYLYRHKVDPVMHPYFDYYEDRGWLDVRKFKIPKAVKTQIYGQAAMVQDCLMRNIYKAKYVVLIDLDEMLVPQQVTDMTWLDMIKSAGCFGNSIIVARNIFHRLDFPDDVTYIHDPYYGDENGKDAFSVKVREMNLISLLKTWRTNDFLKPGDRSKTILRPEHIEIVHIHHSQAKPELRESPCFLQPEVGALHHYRMFRKDLFKDDVIMVRDRTFQKYEQELARKVANVYDNIAKYKEAYN